MTNDKLFQSLIDFMQKVPSINNLIASGFYEDGNWWVKFKIDINNQLAWQVVQEFGCVINYLSIDERLPTVFYPLSPAPYLNGGPEDFLSWIIESKDKEFRPDTLMEWLEGRLPRPVEDLAQWDLEEE